MLRCGGGEDSKCVRVTVVKEELEAYPEFLVVYINSEQVLGPGVAVGWQFLVKPSRGRV